MKQVLYCLKCGNALSRKVDFLGGANSLLASGRGRPNTNLVEEGEAFLSSEPYTSSFGKGPFETEKLPQYWLSIIDIIEANICLDQTTFICCGYNGQHTWNAECAKCNQIVGSEMSDCEIARVFIAKPDTTILHKPVTTYHEKLDFFRKYAPRKRHKK